MEKGHTRQFLKGHGFKAIGGAKDTKAKFDAYERQHRNNEVYHTSVETIDSFHEKQLDKENKDRAEDDSKTVRYSNSADGANVAPIPNQIPPCVRCSIDSTCVLEKENVHAKSTLLTKWAMFRILDEDAVNIEKDERQMG